MFSNVGKIKVKRPGLFDLSIKITLNNNVWINKFRRNSGIGESSLTIYTNHGDGSTVINKSHRRGGA